MTPSNIPAIQQDFSKLDDVERTRDVAITAAILHALQQSGVNLSQDQLKAAYEAAENFSNSQAGQAFSQSSHDALSPNPSL